MHLFIYFIYSCISIGSYCMFPEWYGLSLKKSVSLFYFGKIYLALQILYNMKQTHLLKFYR
jgi:hypothetical protein